MELKWNKFENRKEKLNDAITFLKETEVLDSEYDRKEQIRTKHFEELNNALNSCVIKIVMVGEFSRGKSMLMNAIMGLNILPTALTQTTAINTFIQKAENNPCVKIVFLDKNRKPEELPLEINVLEKWGTELDRENATFREEVERIEVFTDHPLFQNDIMLIDTPGFHGVLPLHEDIAKRAINESHVAIWVQSAEQLGGLKQEWNLLKEIIAENFNKFITVVNKWDFVHNEAKEQCKNKNISHQEQKEFINNYCESQLSNIRKKFREECKIIITEEKIKLLTNSNNFMGTSAKWAFSDDLVEKENANIQKLANRIQEMCTTGEASKEILVKPLKTLLKIQKTLKEDIKSELSELENPNSFEDLTREKKSVDHDISFLELEKKTAEMESRHEHREYSKKFALDIQETLIRPLKELNINLESYITEDYIQRQVDNKTKNIELPKEVKDEYENITHKIYKLWEDTKEKLLLTLEDLRTEFAKSMNPISDKLNTSFSGTTFNLHKLDVNLDINLETIEIYQTSVMDLEAQIDKYEYDMADIDEAMEKNNLLQEEIEEKKIMLRQKVESLYVQRSNLGYQPSAIKKSETRVKKGTWKDTPYTVEVLDNSNVKAWQSKKNQLQYLTDNEEKVLSEIQQDLIEKKGKKITKERAKKQLIKDKKKKEKELKDLREKHENATTRKVSEIVGKMKKRTIFHVETIISTLENNISKAVEKLFEDQLNELLQCVQEQYGDRLETRKKQLESVEKQLKEGKESVTQRKDKLKIFIERLKELIINTEELYSNI